ncbi:hypothetical protein HELRODRAFT_171114 [Helobdella robusta]|uniref:Uncharacterized protein n=1 Tax=Helobdella robusta TaxID=6412 RepID=T1F3T8_HELRO|nr:hypothetical protein HELRODRAFT_171114 [Helobdella robusta]ESO05483.1 hypothetical protein HELRODRAFT_171114 [Helobdella robusta]
MNNHSIPRTSSTKFLGVIIKDNLSWDMHIDSLSKKINKTIGVIKIKDLLKQSGYEKRKLLQIIRRGLFKVFGHIMRKEKMENLTTTGKIAGKRNCGQQQITFVNVKDRVLWRSMVANVLKGYGTGMKKEDNRNRHCINMILFQMAGKTFMLCFYGKIDKYRTLTTR